MHFLTTRRLDDGTLEREFLLDEIPGILWTPEPSLPVPLLLLEHPGDLAAMGPRLRARAQRTVADGFAAATIELPGGGTRPPLPDVERARADLRTALATGQPVGPDIVDRLVLPLVDRAVPEWQATMDALLALPGIGGPVGVAGGVVSIGVRLAVVDPRIAALGLFAGSFIPRAILDDARAVTVPAHVLLQWDDEHNDRQAALDLFDALGSAEKSLVANMGGHTGVPAHAGEAAAGFFARHLR